MLLGEVFSSLETLVSSFFLSLLPVVLSHKHILTGFAEYLSSNLALSPALSPSASSVRSSVSYPLSSSGIHRSSSSSPISFH